MRYSHRSALVLLLVFTFCAAGAHAIGFTAIYDLGLLNGSGLTATYGYGLNESRSVVGGADGVGASHGFLWDYNTSTMSDITPAGATGSWGHDINGHNQIAGEYFSPSTSSVPHAVVINGGGTATPLGNLAGGTNWGQALGLNNSGLVVGRAGGSTGYGHAALWDLNGDPSSPVDLGLLLGTDTSSVAYDVNGSGAAVGISGKPLFTTAARAVLFENGGVQDLGDLGGPQSRAFAINEFGQIVGRSDVDANRTQEHAFLYENGSMTDLGGGNYSSARGINNGGLIVGLAGDSSSTSTAALWESGNFFDLASLVTDSDISLWSSLDVALDVNDYGDVVGYGTINDEVHAFLLTSDGTGPQAPIVPEPATLGLLAAGIGAVALRRRFHSPAR